MDQDQTSISFFPTSGNVHGSDGITSFDSPTFCYSQEQNLSVSTSQINFNPDYDLMLRYPPPYLQQGQPNPFNEWSTPYHPNDEPFYTGGVLGSPFTPTITDFALFNQGIEYSHTPPFLTGSQASCHDQSIPPLIRVNTDVGLHNTQLSPAELYSSPSSSGRSSLLPPSPAIAPLPGHSPTSPLFSPIASYGYHPNPVWDIVFAHPSSGRLGPIIPQKIYRPHTISDRKRYVEEVVLEEPIMFVMRDPSEFGIPLTDALSGRYMRLLDRDDPMFEQRGPSVSIRLRWPGYESWSRQIPTKDFRSTPGPITRAKLAKNIARTIERFIKEKQDQLEPGEDHRFRVGPGFITIDDLLLVGLHHVSKGSWQAHLRLISHPTY